MINEMNVFHFTLACLHQIVLATGPQNHMQTLSNTRQVFSQVLFECISLQSLRSQHTPKYTNLHILSVCGFAPNLCQELNGTIWLLSVWTSVWIIHYRHLLSPSVAASTSLCFCPGIWCAMAHTTDIINIISGARQKGRYLKFICTYNILWAEQGA